MVLQYVFRVSVQNLGWCKSTYSIEHCVVCTDFINNQSALWNYFYFLSLRRDCTMRWVPKGLTVSLLKLFTFLTLHNKIFILFFCDFFIAHFWNIVFYYLSVLLSIPSNKKTVMTCFNKPITDFYVDLTYLSVVKWFMRNKQLSNTIFISLEMKWL